MARNPVQDELKKHLASMLEAEAIERGTTVRQLAEPTALALSELIGNDGAFSSVSDERTKNNSTKQTYLTLNDEEKAQVDAVKTIGAALIGILHQIGETDPEGERLASRDLSLAATHIEDGVMRAVRHITK